MEPNKLENQFREKLNNRGIVPSETAWDRLDAMLSVADSSPDNYRDEQAKQKPKHKFSWLYIAASIIGFLLVSTLFFNQKENTIDIKKNNVVIKNETQKNSSKTENKSLKKDLDYSNTILKQDTKPLVETQNKIENNVIIRTNNTQEEVLVAIQITNNQDQTIVVNKNAIPTNIDSLLASVEKKPNSELKKSSIKINSNTLLNQVDGELQVSFREKALNAITQKYKEAKEALVNRNNQ
jgi:stress response protein SCP2